MKTNYKPGMTLKKAALMALPGVLLGVVTGALTVLQGWDGNQAVAATVMAVVVGGLTGGLRALENWIKNSGVIMVLFVIGACACFPGCVSLTPYSPGALSSNNVRVSESVATEYGNDTFNIEVKSRGEAASKTGLDYSAGGESPWRFILNGEANVTSEARVSPYLEGVGAAYASLPDAIAPFIEAFHAAPDGEAGASIRDVLLQKIIEVIMGRIGSGGLSGVLR